jgi:hypothetical protein
MRDIYNSFVLQYNKDQGSNTFTKKISILKTDLSAFPSITADWETYVTGIQSYNLAKSLWTFAHEGYLLSESINSPDETLTTLTFYVDIDSDENSPVLYLEKLIAWTGRQHYIVEFSLPITPTNINIELTDTIAFSNTVLTSGVQYTGYVSNITVDSLNDQIKLKLICEKDDTYYFTNLESSALILDGQYSPRTSTDRTQFPIYDGSPSRLNTIDSELVDRSDIEELI